MMLFADVKTSRKDPSKNQIFIILVIAAEELTSKKKQHILRTTSIKFLSTSIIRLR